MRRASRRARSSLATEDAGGDEEGVRVAAGEGEVMTGTVRDTHALFVTAGVLCGE